MKNCFNILPTHALLQLYEGHQSYHLLRRQYKFYILYTTVDLYAFLFAVVTQFDCKLFQLFNTCQLEKDTDNICKQTRKQTSVQLFILIQLFIILTQIEVTSSSHNYSSSPATLLLKTEILFFILPFQLLLCAAGCPEKKGLPTPLSSLVPHDQSVHL